MRRTPAAAGLVAASLAAAVTAAIAVAAGPEIHLTHRGNELARTTSLRAGDFARTFKGGFVAGRPGLRSCGRATAPDAGLRVTGFARARFASATTRITSSVTVFKQPRDANVFFRRVRAAFTPRCAASAFGDRGTVVAATPAPVRNGLQHALAYDVVLARGGRRTYERVWVLGQGRLQASLVVTEANGRIGSAGALALSLLTARIED